MPEAMHRKLKRLADRESTSMTYEVLTAVRAHLDASEKREGK
jgi:hypothetical protein